MLKEAKKFLVIFIGVILICNVVSASWGVEITSPVNGSLLGEKPTQFIWSTTTEINNLQNNFLFIINGNENPGLTNRSELKEALKLEEIKEGWNELNISVTNNTGFVKNHSVSFWVDSIAPVITVLTPFTNPFYTNHTTFSIEAKLNETNWKYATTPITFYFWDFDSLNPPTKDFPDTRYPSIDKDTNTSVATYNYYVGDGEYLYNLTSEDIIGHVGLISGSIFIDTQKPIVNFTNLNQGQFIGGVFNITTSSEDILKDGYKSGINHTDIEIINSSFSVVDSGYLNSSESSWNWDTTNLSEGTYTIKATTYDKAGNFNSSEINVIVDNTAPISNNDAPSFWRNNDFNVTLNATDFGSGVAYINYSLNGSWEQVFGNETKVLISESGNQSLEYFAVDNAGNIETTNLVYVLLDKIAPNTTTDFNSSKWHNANVTITLNATDFDSGVKEIWYKINNNSLTNSSGDNLSILVSDEGINNLTYFAVDNAGNNETNKTIQIMIDKTAPVIFVQSPMNATTYNTNTIWFNATADDEITNWIVNYNGTDIGLAVINSSLEVEDGNYNLSIYAEDKAGNIGLNDSIWFSVDTTGPEINLIESPLNNSIFNWIDKTQTIKFNANDFSGIDDCILYLNNEKYDLNKSGLNYTNISDYPAGTYSWYIFCNDSLGNSRETGKEYFTILSNFTEAGDYNYTDLTNETDISNVLYFYVNNTYGMINFTEAIDFSSGFDWSQFIEISNLRVYVNSSFSELNKTAIITFYNVNFTTPEVLKNGDVYCFSAGENCPTFNYDRLANILTISVKGFTEYTVREKPVVVLSSGGGGGSSSCRYEENYDWECSAWSECLEGVQTRTCKESNNCGTTFGRPIVQQTCIMPEPEFEEIIEETEIQEEELVQPSSSGITGAVIGFAKSGKGIASFVFIALVSVAGIGVTLFRKYR